MCQPHAALALPHAALFGTHTEEGTEGQHWGSHGPQACSPGWAAWLWKWLKWWLTAQSLASDTLVYITLSSLHWLTSSVIWDNTFFTGLMWGKIRYCHFNWLAHINCPITCNNNNNTWVPFPFPQESINLHHSIPVREKHNSVCHFQHLGSMK